MAKVYQMGEFFLSMKNYDNGGALYMEKRKRFDIMKTLRKSYKGACF